MHQTQSAAAAVEEIPNDNLSIPHGLVRTVRHYLEFVGVLDYIRGLKTKGVRLDLLVVSVCTYTMLTSNSLNACADWLKNPAVRRQLGFPPDENVSQRTLNRAVAALGKESDGIIEQLWRGIRERFEIDDYDIELDGSAVVLYGPKSEFGEVGYGRDKNRGKLQVEFMVAQLASLGIPIYIKPYKGNVSDEAQYRDCVPEIAGLLSGKGLHSLDQLKTEDAVDEDDEGAMAAVAAVAMLGAAIVADNGAASDGNTSRMKTCGFAYVTRVSLNASDVKNIEEHCSEFEYLGDGMMCYKHHFKTSGKTTFLFLSCDLLMRGYHKTRDRTAKDLKRYEDAKGGKLRRSDYVKISKVPWVNVDVRVTLQEQLVPFSPMDFERTVRERMGLKCGFFKLESDRDMTPREALTKYRHRVSVEHLISSLKRVTGIKPIRVWNPESVAGSMILALLSQAAMAMARYCMTMPGDEPGPTPDEAPNEASGEEKEPEKKPKPSTESMVRALSHLTLTRFRIGKGPFREVLSNWGPISTAVFNDIRLHESPEWGSRKVPVHRRPFPSGPDGASVK